MATDLPHPDLCGHILSSPGLGLPNEVLCDLEPDHDEEHHRNSDYPALMWDDTGTIH